MAEASKSASRPRHQASVVDSTTASQHAPQRWLREFRSPAVREDHDTAMVPARRHIDEYA